MCCLRSIENELRIQSRSSGWIRFSVATGLVIVCAALAVAQEETERAKPFATLTLDQAINLCLVNDPKIRAGLEAINQAHADALTASLRPNPGLTVSSTLLPLARPFTPQSPGGPPELDVQLNYPIDWLLFGKRAAGMASATMGICVSEAEYADLVRQRVTEAALAFYDVLEATALLEVAQQDLENLQRVDGVTRTAVDNGGRPHVELSRVRLELLNTRRRQRDAESALVGAKAKLRALLGGGDSEGPLEVAGTLDGPLTAEPLPPAEAYALAAENRPDILALQRKTAKANANVVVERRNAFPEVKPQFVVGRQYQRSMGVPDVSTWGTGIEVAIPLFDRNQGNRAKAASTVSQSHFELHAKLLDLRAEIEQAVQSLRTAQQNAASVARDELRLAVEVRDSIGKAYAAGGRPLLDVLDSQRNYRETYRTFITSRADYLRALYRYHSAIGKQVTP
jgi:outer membrane protein, heavy metal efflux system